MPRRLADSSTRVNTWPALAAARAHDAAARVPFVVSDAGAAIAAGSVARAHLAALRRWPQWLDVQPERVALTAPVAARADALAEMNQTLRGDGLIVGWRDEPFALFDVDGRAFGVSMERAATRFWGGVFGLT